MALDLANDGSILRNRWLKTTQKWLNLNAIIKPIFIEHNFAGAMYIYQMASMNPIFGNKTDEVLSYIKGLNKA
ncbi:hypothetical protein [Bacillus alkalicola]|uniref:Uncharacterized protein n=1 Tax=Evansella alkalicola TaxID=745819 RepID=A0ABS6JVW1_9BACI|nr:hypothetical protein [Bacillus alkalicola]MBU9722720.1 hypothetical protein [Bacillus alkalicola]